MAIGDAPTAGAVIRVGHDSVVLAGPNGVGRVGSATDLERRVVALARAGYRRIEVVVPTPTPDGGTIERELAGVRRLATAEGAHLVVRHDDRDLV